MPSIKKIGKVGKRYRHLLRYQQIIGIAGFVAATVMGIWLLAAIIRGGRL
ncbi:MAG: hypothetical protein ABR534_08015 [Desulfotignum sp.]|nr:hypothetical protein [Desulfobacteraceae bacterium]